MTGALDIVHAIRSDEFAGVEQFVRRLATEQAQDGHRVTVFGGPPEQMTSLQEAGVRWGPARTTAAVVRAVRAELPTADVVNSHMTAADAAAVVARATSRHGVAIVSTRHFAQQRGSLGPGIMYRRLERHIDAEISISDAVARRVGVPSTVIYPGIAPISAPDPSTRRETVLMAQRLQPEKHTAVAIRAFAASGIWKSGWDLVIAGEGVEHDALVSLAAALGVADHVRLLGFRSDIPELMRDAGLLFASAPFEHFGLTVLEAMGAGLPVVAAAAAGHVEMLDGLDERALFPPDDVSAAAASLQALAADLPARIVLGRQERERQIARFSIKGQAEATEAVYRRAVAARKRTG